MADAVSSRVAELVDLGWEPRTGTETMASLSTQGPFNWWLFVFIIILFPLIGGLLYLVFWLATSRVTVFVYQDEGSVKMAGDVWWVESQKARHEAVIEKHRQIAERGFWRVMGPKLVVLAALFGLWIVALK